jgi:hypothetical protein
LALRKLAAEAGSNAIPGLEVTLRESDFQVVEVRSAETGQPMSAPATAKITFTAAAFKELPDEAGAPSGCWEFGVVVPVEGRLVRAFVYLDGRDILYVKALSALA